MLEERWMVIIDGRPSDAPTDGVSRVIILSSVLKLAQCTSPALIRIFNKRGTSYKTRRVRAQGGSDVHDAADQG